MKGNINVESEFGKGTAFTLRLPVENVTHKTESVPVAASTITTAARDPGRNTVLVVDDDAASRDLMERHLTGAGYRVVTAANGDEALRLARAEQPQVITLDVMMPGMDGWAVLSALKKDEATAAIPVVMATIVGDRNLGHALGAADYLTKPLDRDHLLKILGTYSLARAPGLALVVEDDPSSREVFGRMLQKDGWDVQTANTGREALDLVSARRPAFVVLDLIMPEMDGFEFLAELRQREEWKSIPVIVVTSKDLTAADRQFLNGSALLSHCVRRVLQKGSFTRDDLLREVHELMSPAC